MERYKVSGKRPVVDLVRQAFEASGASVIDEPPHTSAPFEFLIRTSTGERLTVLCYAFQANKYRQAGRPKDEHRFQIKYGSEFDRYHDIFIDPDRDVITLMLGVHVEEGVLIGVDPAMYNPTWFSRSVEFKTHHVEEAKAQGWVGWERERSSGRRKTAMPLASNMTESVFAFTPENLVRFARFERLATGMDTGERLLLAERMQSGGVNELTQHFLEKQYELPADKILDIVHRAFRLEAAVRGAVAEEHLRKHLEKIPGITDVQPLDEDGRPDFDVIFNSRHVLIECKNVLRKPARAGPKVDFQKTRASKHDPCTRYYEPSAFDVLAACLHPVTERWEFRFCRTRTLASHKKCEGRLASNVVVAGSHWTDRLGQLL